MTADGERAGGLLWERIRDDLSADIAEGRYGPGERLPTEAELARRFGVNRHTVRRALQTLREDGRIHVRRGAGATVTVGRFDYRISGRTRFSRNLAETGRTPGRRLLRCETVRAGRAEAAHLGIVPGDPVVVAESVAEADGVPVAYGSAVLPAGRLAGIAELLAARGSITAALTEAGVPDYRRLWTRLTAERPDAVTARHLRISPGTPVIRSESLNVDPAGRPVEYGLSWFCTDRVALVVDRSSFTFPAEDVAGDGETE